MQILNCTWPRKRPFGFILGKPAGHAGVSTCWSNPFNFGGRTVCLGTLVWGSQSSEEAGEAVCYLYIFHLASLKSSLIIAQNKGQGVYDVQSTALNHLLV